MNETTTYIDLDFYCFREQIDDGDGPRLLVPHSNPRLYEYPIDYVFASSGEALVWLGEAIDDEQIDADEANSWVLVHYTGTTIGKDLA